MADLIEREQAIALQTARETNKRLNRRVSLLEGAVRQMWDACQVDGVRLSRRHDAAWAVVREMEEQLKALPAVPTPQEFHQSLGDRSLPNSRELGRALVSADACKAPAGLSDVSEPAPLGFTREELTAFIAWMELKLAGYVGHKDLYERAIETVCKRIAMLRELQRRLGWDNKGD